MSRTFVGVSESDTLQETVALMDDRESGCAVVVRGAQPVGMLTERDVVAAVAAEVDFESTPVDEVMSEPVVTVPAAATLGEALQSLTDERIRRLPVIEDEAVVGIISSRDVLALETGTPPGSSTAPERPGAEVGENAVSGSAGEPVEPAAARASEPVGGEAVGTAQGICESCGRLADDLASIDGRVQCADCRGT